jgi:FixJ family two-component response regulator
MEAESFRTGEALLQMLSAMPSYRPDCLIIDVQMPGLSGLELQERLQGSGLPIVFITAHDDIGVRERALGAGAIAFLRKPFDEEILIKTVNAALKQHGAHAT